MAIKFTVVCAAVLLVQAVAGSKVVHGLSRGSAAATKGAAAASTAAAGATAARGGGTGSAASSSAASAAAASSAVASAAAAREGSTSSAAASAAAAASGASVGSARGALLGLADYDIIYSEPLLVTSTSGFYPTGLSVSSDIGLQGPLYVNGRLPFLSAVGFEGSLATDGSGVSTCGCGSNNIGIIQEV